MTMNPMEVGTSLMQVGSMLAGAAKPQAVPIPPGRAKEPTPGDKALGDALCGKLRELAALPPTTRSLMQLEQTARLSREILVAAIDPYAFRGRDNRGINDYAMPNPGFAGAIGYDLPLPSSELGSPLAPSSYAENFGAAVVRELGASKGATEDTPKNGKPTVLELMAAVNFAREKGMNDLAAKLEDGIMKLMQGGSVEVVVDESAKEVAPETPKETEL
jgi:hypothetical protein